MSWIRNKNSLINVTMTVIVGIIIVKSKRNTFSFDPFSERLIMIVSTLDCICLICLIVLMMLLLSSHHSIPVDRVTV